MIFSCIDSYCHLLYFAVLSVLLCTLCTLYSALFQENEEQSYDCEMSALQEMVQKKVVVLLNDPDNAVKIALIDGGDLGRLCLFFGQQKGELSVDGQFVASLLPILVCDDVSSNFFRHYVVSVVLFLTMIFSQMMISKISVSSETVFQSNLHNGKSI